MLPYPQKRGCMKDSIRYIHKVEIATPKGMTRDERKIWCYEHINRCWSCEDTAAGRLYRFADECDALMFRLRWAGQSND